MYMVGDWPEWRKEKNFMTIVKDPEEMYTLGGLNKGMYDMQDNFTMQFCVQGPDEAAQKQAASIPHSDKMRKIVIT